MATPHCATTHIIAQAYRDLAKTFDGDTTGYIGQDIEKFLNELAHETENHHA